MVHRILSVQSHVVSGYCGNKCATFPLQLLGFEVDALNSVQLSNHTQYDQCKGYIFDSNHLDQVRAALESNKILQLYDNVLSGYVGNVGFVKSLGALVNQIKHARQVAGLEFSYTLDPVLGDIDCDFYVPDGRLLTQAYQENLLHLANIITPNAFEASLLTGVELNVESTNNCLDQCVKAIDCLHDKGIEIVALTSIDTKFFADDELVCFLSGRSSNSSNLGKLLAKNGDDKIHIIRIPKLQSTFYGTGDLFAALLTAWLNKTKFDLKKSLENTVNTIQTILLDTYDKSQSFKDNTSPLAKELRIIQNQTYISNPLSNLKAQVFE